MSNLRLPVSILIILGCIIFRTSLEADPVTHVLVQLPLLAWAGMLLVEPKSFKVGNWNNGGFPLLLIALVTIIYWMLPRSIDAALTSPYMEAAKFISIPLLIGIPLKLGWHAAHPLLRGFLKAQTISMLGILSFVYIHAPVRICNAYLVDDQERLGYGFLIAAIGIAIGWIIPLFITQHNTHEAPSSPARAA